MNSETRDYLKTNFGRIPSANSLMDKYVPGFADANTSERRAFYPHKTKDKEGAIPRKYKELIMIALEVGSGRGGTRSPGISHTRTAVKEAGVTPKEIAEVVAITVYMCGQPSLVDWGCLCITAAEEEYSKISQKR